MSVARSSRRLPVCPTCGEYVSEEPRCDTCGEDLTEHEKLPLRGEWELEHPGQKLVRSAPVVQKPPAQPRQSVQCPVCYGSGRNKRGGPCGHCRATGQVRGLAAAGAMMSATGSALIGLFWGAVALAILVAIIVGVLHG